MSSTIKTTSALAAFAVVATDGDAVQVPTELHNYFHAQVDAKGNVRVLETDGPTAPTKTVEPTK